MWENPDDAPNRADFQVPEVPGRPDWPPSAPGSSPVQGSGPRSGACTGAVADSRASKSDEVEGQQRFDFAA